MPKIKYQCVYCNKYFNSEPALLSHFENCPKNPENKSCGTCASADCKSPYTYGCKEWVDEKWFM